MIFTEGHHPKLIAQRYADLDAAITADVQVLTTQSA